MNGQTAKPAILKIALMAAALVFPTLFFPADIPPLAAQLASFSTFAVGFIARPLGGIVFGHVGDLFGRKRALVTALLTMGFATSAIGLLPSFATAGVMAPLLLIALRFVQGIAVGGQWGGAALLAIESAPASRRGYYGGFVQTGVPLGVVLANVVFLIVNGLIAPEQFAAWGWRVPFLVSVFLVAIGIYIQLQIEETATVEQGAGAAKLARRRSPIVAVVFNHPRTVFLAGGAFVANNTCFYITITYVVAYATSVLHVAKGVMLAVTIVGNVAMIPVLVLCGGISDRWGRRPLFMAGAVLTAVWAFAFFPLVETRIPFAIGLSITVELFFLSVMYGPQAALFAELFPAEVRYSGASLGYQLGSVVGGGFAPIVATLLFAKYHATWAIAVFMSAMCVVSFACTAAMRGRSH